MCNIEGCRYPHTHTSVYHKCGGCLKRGHGQVECEHAALLRNLLDSFEDFKVSEECPCNVLASYHTLEGHQCGNCGAFGHIDCETNFTLKCPTCREMVAFNEGQKLFTDSMCVICQEFETDWVLTCGHSFCKGCLLQIKSS
jgi:hypothetical protein